MVTPDFEEWLMRQDIPIEDTTTLKRYQEYLEEEFGIHTGSLVAAEDVYKARYDILPQLGIRPFTRHYEARGEPMVETRYGISGYPGLWGIERMYEIALEKAEELKWEFATTWIKTKREQE